MRASFALALVINLFILLGYSVSVPSADLQGDFGERSRFPDEVTIAGGTGPWSMSGIRDAMRLMGYVQTALSTTALILFLTSNGVTIVRNGCVRRSGGGGRGMEEGEGRVGGVADG